MQIFGIVGGINYDRDETGKQMNVGRMFLFMALVLQASNLIFILILFQECPAGSIDFRQAQCESYNGKQFMGRYYVWEAYWDGKTAIQLNLSEQSSI